MEYHTIESHLATIHQLLTEMDFRPVKPYPMDDVEKCPEVITYVNNEIGHHIDITYCTKGQFVQVKGIRAPDGFVVHPLAVNFRCWLEKHDLRSCRHFLAMRIQGYLDSRYSIRF